MGNTRAWNLWQAFVGCKPGSLHGGFFCLVHSLGFAVLGVQNSNGLRINTDGT